MISDTYKINGRVLSEVSWNVRLQDSVLTAKDIKVSVNADALDIKAEPYFKKTSGDKLAVDLEGFVRDETLVVNSKRIQLNQLKLGLSSSVSLKDKMMADIKVDLDRAQLKGLEKMFPPLAKQPMQGEIEFHSELKGPLSEGAESLRLSVNPIVLKNFKSSVNLKDDKNRIYASGPVSANLQGAVKVVKNELDYGTLRGSVDLTKVALNYKAKFKKKSGQRLSASLNLGQNKQSLVTKGSTLNYGPSVLELKGSVRGFVSPSFKLNLKLSNFQTSLVDKTPYWPKDMVANGAVAGNFDLSGKFDQKVGIEKSPIKVKGSVNANFSNFEYMPEPVEVNAEVAAEPTPKLKTVPAFLPTWPVIQDLNLSVDTRVAKFRKNKISGKGLLVKAVVQKGGASVSGKVAEIFAGEVTLKKLLVPLIWENPVIRMSAAVKGLDVPLAFQSLDLQGLPKMTGVATGAVELTTELPESERFLSAMTSSGSLNLANFELKEISLTESMMKNLSKLKKLGVKADTNVKGFKGVANLAYILKNEVMKVSKLDLVSFNKDEFKLKGTLKLAGPVDLKGSVILSKPPFKGEVYECNTDKQGRMTFPVVVKANWMDPDFTVPKQSLDALLSNTLKCQQKKLEKQVKKEADKKLKDVKKKVEGQLQDAVKDLFK
ncbi:MAG: hypothetical protein HRT45_07010 [Bdellovibrionales bacterium]|nr:hypothetical protein [Bdellovibrionales bacterium]